MKLFLASAAALLALSGASHGAVRLSEIYINPPGTDNGQEFFELVGTPGQSLANTWLIIIEGDAAGAGVVDQAINLGALSLGTNGLFLWRDASTTIDTSPAAGVQGPSAGTSVNVADFSPDIENGSNSYLLVTEFTGAVGNDLDTNGDGTFDVVLPWASVIDGIALIENDGASNFGYADDVGFTTFGPDAGYNADLLILGSDNVWYGGDTLGANPGFYSLDPARNSLGSNGDQFGATPGVRNSIPAPGAFALTALGGLLAARRRRV